MCLVYVLACGDDSATGIDVVTISLSPDSADVVAGQETQMKAEVLDLHGRPVEGLLPTWESADTSIATVDASGAVRGRSEGLVDIRVSVPGAEDVSRVRVLPHPRIVVSDSAVLWAVGAGGPPPPARTLSIGNGGAGTVGTIALTLRHTPESPAWLAAELQGGQTPPTTIEVRADTEGLGAGAYRATLLLTSDSAGVGDVEVPVSLILTDFTLGETGDTTVVPEVSGTDTVLVTLDAQPTSSVALSVSVSGTSATASPLRLDFTPDDWDEPRVVLVSGVDDPAVDGDETSELVVAVDAAASDSAFHGIPPKALQIVTLDDDRPGLVITESGQGTRVTEDGTDDTLTAALAAQPLTEVVLTVSSDRPGEASAIPSVLTFTPTDWSTPQVITVSAIDDPDVDGDRTSTVVVRVDEGRSDAAFHGLVDSIEVTTEDDDAAGLLVVESSGGTVVSEGGVADELEVSLTARPAGPVVLEVVTDDPAEVAVTPTRVTFTRSGWATPQVVTVVGVQDGIADGPRTSRVTLSIDRNATDDAFDDVPPVSVLVITQDTDTTGLSDASPTGHAGVSSQGLVAAYDMTTPTPQGLLKDFAGHGLHGSISGTSVVASPREGARLFQVATDRIELPARADFDMDGPLSLVARFRVDVSRRHQHVLACDDKFALAVREADQVRFSNTRGDYAETVAPLSTGAWHDVVAIFRGTAGDPLDDSNIEIWIDGVLAPVRLVGSSGSVPPVWRDGVLHPTDACYIGFESHQGDPTHQNLAFHGAVDEILIFDRALTAAEAQLLSQSP